MLFLFWPYDGTRVSYVLSVIVCSHSIFSIRIMRVEDGSIPRVLGISEYESLHLLPAV